MDIVVTTGQGPRECSYFLKKALPLFEKEAKKRGIKWKCISKQIGSATISLSEPMEDWIGVWEWRSRSPFRPNHKRSRWFIEAKVLEGAAPSWKVKEHDVQFQSLRAGGPGGQHQNKTESAVRATWVSPNGRQFQVVSRQERSQHRNKKIALEMLLKEVNDYKAVIDDNDAYKSYRSKKLIDRGGAVKSFSKL